MVRNGDLFFLDLPPFFLRTLLVDGAFVISRMYMLLVFLARSMIPWVFVFLKLKRPLQLGTCIISERVDSVSNCNRSSNPCHRV